MPLARVQRIELEFAELEKCPSLPAKPSKHQPKAIAQLAESAQRKKQMAWRFLMAQRGMR